MLILCRRGFIERIASIPIIMLILCRGALSKRECRLVMALLNKAPPATLFISKLSAVSKHSNLGGAKVSWRNHSDSSYSTSTFAPTQTHGLSRRRRRPSHAVQNGSSSPSSTTTDTRGRYGEIVRVTKETNVQVKINLDGTGISDCSTGIPFLDHMLDQIASHGIFDIQVKACGDIHIDDHHTNEDVALSLGNALLQALGDRKGIYRFGDFSAPLDEALIHVSLDLSGRPYLAYDLCIPTERVGTYDTQLVEHFFQSLVNTSGMTLHIRQLAGKNSHHIVEAAFKAFARALRQATEYDIRRSGSIPSSKGVLSRT